MREQLYKLAAALLASISALAMALIAGRATYIVLIIIYIVIINISFLVRLTGHQADIGAVLLGLIILSYSILKIIGFYNVYLVDIIIATVTVVLASLTWSCELVQSQYTTFYPISIIAALILGYLIGAPSPLQLVLISSLESHLVYHVLSHGPLIEGAVLAVLYGVTVYSLVYTLTGLESILPPLAFTFALKVALAREVRASQVYASADFYLKVLVGGMLV